MRRGFLAFACLAILSPFAGAQVFDRAKLRNAIELPTINSAMSVDFKSRERDGQGNKLDPVKKILELQKKLTGTADDAEIYFELRAVYLDLAKDEKKAKELAQKAEEILRPHLQTADPKKGHLLTLYGNALQILNDNPWNDCDKLARRAVSVAPQDWRTWAYLAHARHQQIPTILCGGDDKHLPRERRTQEVIGSLYLQRFRLEHVDEAEKTLNEVLQYHDKAKDLAPNEPRRQELRYGFRLSEIILRNAMAAARGQKPTYRYAQYERHALDELEVTAKLHPDHLLWQSQLAHQLILRGWAEAGEKDKKQPRAFRPARADDLKAIQEACGRIEKIAQGVQGESAIYCYSVLLALHASMMNHAAVENTARKMVQIDEKNQVAWEQLQHALAMQERYVDLLQTAQGLVEKNPSARNWYLLAKALAANQRYDVAEKACLSGFKADPGHVHCLLGLAALTMRKGDDAQSLKLAGDLIERARREARPDLGASVFAEIDYVAALHQALTGEHAFARVKLRQMQDQHPDQKRFEKILTSLPQ